MSRSITSSVALKEMMRRLAWQFYLANGHGIQVLRLMTRALSSVPPGQRQKRPLLGISLGRS